MFLHLILLHFSSSSVLAYSYITVLFINLILFFHKLDQTCVHIYVCKYVFPSAWTPKKPCSCLQTYVELNWRCWWPNTFLSHFKFHLHDEAQTDRQSYNKSCHKHLGQRLADDRDEISEDLAVRRKQKPHQTEASTKALLTVSWIQSNCCCELCAEISTHKLSSLDVWKPEELLQTIDRKL